MINLMKAIIFSISGLILLSSAPCSADTGKEPDNYCKDAVTWQQWHGLLEKNPQDDALHALYAMRLGLCSMVEAGNIDLDRATRIFEKMRGSLIDRYREQEKTEQDRGKQAM